MSKRPIVFLDSGVGGLTYLQWIRERLPCEELVYLADTAEFPYGEKDHSYLKRLVKDRVDQLKSRFSPKLIVLACNTASVVTLGFLRDSHSIPLVGTVPAIKLAAFRRETRRIVLLATERTVEERYTENLIREFASHCEVIRLGAPNLVNFVELELFSSTPKQVEHALAPLTAKLAECRADAVVLGCTHFIYLKEFLAKLIPEDVAIVDSVDGVGTQILRIVGDVGRESCLETTLPRLYTTSAIDKGGLLQFISQLAIDYRGVLA